MKGTLFSITLEIKYVIFQIFYSFLGYNTTRAFKYLLFPVNGKQKSQQKPQNIS